jgi:hypothetical protein
VRSTGRNHWPHTIPRPPDTTPRVWPSEGAHSDTGSGDAWHRPNHTRAMWLSIRPRRPNRASGSVRQPATPGQDHGHDLLVRPGRRTREVRRPNTVRGRPPSRTQFRSVFRNGDRLAQWQFRAPRPTRDDPFPARIVVDQPWCLMPTRALDDRRPHRRVGRAGPGRGRDRLPAPRVRRHPHAMGIRPPPARP